MSESYWKVRIVWWGTSSRMLLQASWNVGGRSQWQQEFVCPDSWDAQEMTGQAAVECLQRLVAWTRTEEGGRWFDDEEHSTAFMLKEAFRLFSNSRFDIKKREVA